ncbi:hypothetical protein [Corynebacterium fournieri]|uniref:hypothetical protein n=1 Tax=Corynebacterium fournieri TaxID=1852390 RepID=UPI000A2F5317|nr:hypothetical protein [Corynebacterium fournieri]WJY97316.1 hypothetical protein CFOUR_04445 [Corynebacterium fournieri]
MKKTSALLAAIAVSFTAVTAPASDGQELSHADLYEPRVYSIGSLSAGPSDNLVTLIVNEGPEFADLDILEFESPYPVTYERIRNPIVNFNDKIYLRLEQKMIYPEEFEIAVKLLVHYNDGSSEEVEGSFPVHPLPALVSGNPKPSATTKQSTSPVATKTVVKTTTVTAEASAPVTTTVTQKINAPTTVTETAEAATTTTTVTKKAAPVTATVTETVEAATATVTETISVPAPAETATVTKTAEAETVTTTVQQAPVTATETVTATAAPATVEVTKTVPTTVVKASNDGQSGSSTGSIVALVLGLLALIGGVGAAVAGNPQLLANLPF